MTLRDEACRYARAVIDTYGELPPGKIRDGALDAARNLEAAAKMSSKSSDLIGPYDNATRAEAALIDYLEAQNDELGSTGRG